MLGPAHGGQTSGGTTACHGVRVLVGQSGAAHDEVRGSFLDEREPLAGRGIGASDADRCVEGGTPHSPDVTGGHGDDHSVTDATAHPRGGDERERHAGCRSARSDQTPRRPERPGRSEHDRRTRSVCSAAMVAQTVMGRLLG